MTSTSGLWNGSRAGRGWRGWRGCLAACLLALCVSCGIDDQVTTGTTPTGPTWPDITGVWQGQFVSAQTGEIIQITRLTFIKSAEDTYAVDFDVEFTITGYFLWYWTNVKAWHGTIDQNGNMYMESQQGGVTMSSHIDSATHIKGNWLLRFPIENDGTWEVNKVAELDP